MTFVQRPGSGLEAQAAHFAEHVLVARAVSGEAQAARAIVEKHHGGMYSLALSVIADPVEAEDLVQESFERAFSRLHQFDPKYRLSTWLYRIVLNTCRDHLKSPRRKERPCEDQYLRPNRDPTDPEVPLIKGERSVRLHKALAELRPQYKEIIVLKDLMELSYDEIQAITGMTVTGLKIRAIMARARLRKLLEA